MAHAVRLLPAQRLAVVRLAGELDGAGLLGALHGIVADPAWERGFRVAWDARYLRVLDLVPEDMGPFAGVTAEVAERMGPGRSAVLARGLQDEVTVQLLNLRRRGHPGRELRAFLRWQDAVAWLGVPEYALDVDTLWRPWVPPEQGERGRAGGRPGAT